MTSKLDEFLKDLTPRAHRSKLLPHAADIEALLNTHGASFDQVAEYLAKHHQITISREGVRKFIVRYRQKNPPLRFSQVTPAQSSMKPSALKGGKPESRVQPVADLTFRTSSENQGLEDNTTVNESSSEFVARVTAENEKPEMKQLKTLFSKSK